jgi:glycosyltransferase involved in cell wall biosynthesis
MELNPFRRFHRWVDDADWARPRLDGVASRTTWSRVPTTVDRVAPDRPAPRERHLVSVVVPCYNYGRYLPAAVGSVLEQRDVDVEVVVVDDASTDDSAEVAGRLASDPRVRVLRNATNQGHVRTFNNGLALVTGEFVVRLDADDLLTPGSLARAVALFEAHPSVGLVYGHPRHFETVEPPAPRTGTVTWTVWPGTAWIRERCRRGVNCITTPEAVVRARVLGEVGPLNPALRFAQDMEMWLRAAAVSDVGHVNDVDQALHRDHDDSMSATDGAGILTDITERREVFRQLFLAVGDRIPASAAMAGLADRALAREALAHAGYLYDRGRADDELVQRLVEFARATYDGSDTLLAARALRLRRRLGRDAVKRDPTALVRVGVTRGRAEKDYLRWAREGL